MRVKRLFVLTGVVALMGLLWATPAVADSHQSITVDPASVPAVEGDVTITVTGADWTEPVPFFITACPGAQGDPTVIVDTVAAITMCPNIAGDSRAVAFDGGSFTTEITVTITQDDIDAGGLVVLAGWLSASASPATAAAAILAIADEPMDDMDDEATDDEATDDEATDDEATDDEATDDEELPDTGAESSLLLIVGAGVLAAGLLVVGAGRRVRTVTR